VEAPAVAPLDLGVLVSGTGTNLGAILAATADGRLAARVRLVVSNKPGVLALDRAAEHGVPGAVVSHKDFATREAFDAELVQRLRAAGVTHVVLAGFMRVVTPVLLDAFPDRVINVHPAILPAFPGVDAQAQALAYGVRVTGCTVHFVDAGVDTGPIVAQAIVPVEDDDDRSRLAARILVREHELLVSALQWIAEGRVSIERTPGTRPRVRVAQVAGRSP
jgi:phosphoribosylglycinamide formyltransferase-1